MIAVCLKWVSQRIEPDLDADTAPDARFADISAADRAALEWALRCRDAWGVEVVAISVGPASADTVLRHATAAGADRSMRIDAEFGAPSRAVASMLATHLRDASMVLCGDYSADRGSASVPGFLAAELGFAQALGLVELTVGAGATIDALRRLDGGRRDRLTIGSSTVLSVEGSTALLRRIPLRALLAARPVDVHPGAGAGVSSAGTTRPYRPRPRVLAAPAGASALERVKALTTSSAPVAHGDPIVLEPAEAADRIVATLRDWGYLDPATNGPAARLTMADPAASTPAAVTTVAGGGATTVT